VQCRRAPRWDAIDMASRNVRVASRSITVQSSANARRGLNTNVRADVQHHKTTILGHAHAETHRTKSHRTGLATQSTVSTAGVRIHEISAAVLWGGVGKNTQASSNSSHGASIPSRPRVTKSDGKLGAPVSTKPRWGDDDLEAMGWGGALIEEEQDILTKFEACGRDYGKMYKQWENAFRWTCCGVQGGSGGGCDHHGSRGRCSCDYCRSGKVYRAPPQQCNRLLHEFCNREGSLDWDCVRGIPWSIADHPLFPEHFHRRVIAFLLSNGSADALKTLSSDVAVAVVRALASVEARELTSYEIQKDHLILEGNSDSDSN